MLFLTLPLLISIVTGDAQAFTNISNQTNGGNVETKITTSVNGQTNTVESDKPGTIKVENYNGAVKVQNSRETDPAIKISPIINASPTADAGIKDLRKTINNRKFFILNYLKEFVNLLGHLLGWKT